MAAILAALLPSILPVLGTIVAGLLAWLAKSIAEKNAAMTAASKAATAGLKLAAIGTALLQKAWDKLGPQIQTALADGKIDTAERAAIEVTVSALIHDVTDEATIKEIGEALGLPLAGIIAKVVSYLIEKWTEAHDPVIVTASANTFPTPAMRSDPMTLVQGAAPDPTAG